ncbi:TetR/AcrR family transcriptional regulator [Breoghania sp.]|uniref:TetR/AcrR family transcriptional regulator n=1 Tax=Breoghania sp. TaxID=2065378 RepID=UPI00262DD173|nr:TetR/AcrR family transcriptional regulator [Breoghania sp.]MDJ0929863.1 TetR/AcrR family transcriptional regulator [Breoghania sp.]
MARTRAADYDDKRDAIHRAAARILSKADGKASMTQIATACGISKALLYHYFRNRDELVFDIIHTHLSEIDRALADAVDGLQGRERLHCLSATLLDLYENADDLHRLQLGALGALPDEDARRIRQVERSILEHFRSTIREIAPDLERGRFIAVTMALMGMLNWAFTWFRPGGPLTRADFARMATEMALSEIDGQ